LLLFQRRFHAGLLDGSVTLTFRRWARPHVKPGGRYRVHPVGVVEVSAVGKIRLGEITTREARAAGFRDLGELHAFLAAPAKLRGGGAVDRGPVNRRTVVWRVVLRHAGEEDRVDLALQDDLSADDVETVAARLRKLDARAPWTRDTLSLIARHPRTAASRLAARVGRETLPFKVDVRKLKRLGLTVSYEVGYGLSPRGKAFLARRRRW
jgi:hypothetical protein